jgi:hypothetical protein
MAPNTNGDEAALISILDEWHSDPESVPGDGIASELVRTIRKIAQVERRLTSIGLALAELTTSALYRLRQDVLAAESRGRDLLAEMAADLKGQIASLQSELTTLCDNVTKGFA